MVAMVLLSVDAEFPKVEIGFICPAIPSKALLSTHINVIRGNKLLLVHVGLPECGRNEVDSGTPSSGFNRCFINIPPVQQFLCPFTVWIQLVGI